MMVNMRCSQCGAEISVDNSLPTAFCKYCGNQMSNASAAQSQQNVQISQTVNVVHTIDRSNEPNLYINYMSVNPSVMMVTRIADTGQKNTYISGQTMTFRLTPGKHIIVLKIGKINYNREIYITEDNQPVRINASFSGRANINIDQPAYTLAAGVAGTASTPVDAGPRLPKSPWSVLAFVLSFLVFTSPIAVVLGILDLTVLKNKEKSHGMSIAAIAIGACMSFVLIPSCSSCVSSSNYSSDLGYDTVTVSVCETPSFELGE